MLARIATAALVAGSLVASAQAAEAPAPATGPLVLDAQQLDQVSAGFGGLVGTAFWQAHNTLAGGSSGLPEPARLAIGALHGLFLMPMPN
jgi:hypothetical protein